MPKIATLSQGKTTVFTGFGPQKNNFENSFFPSLFPCLLHFFFPRGGRQEHIKHTQKIHTINHAVSTFIRFHSKREQEDESDDAEKNRTRDSLVARACARLFTRVSVFGFGQLPFSLHFTCEMDHRLCFFPIHARNDDALLSSLTLALCSLINQQQ